MKINADTLKFDGTNLTVRVLPESRYAVKTEINELQGKLLIEVKKWYKPRSITANSYAWVLMDKLSAVLGVPKEEVYKGYIEDVGDNFYVVTVPTERKEKEIRDWRNIGLGWLCEDTGDVDGFTDLYCYKGSSTFDSRQMARLIDLIVFDCKEQGISVLSERELSLLKANGDR